jgi:hypothetical protein
MLCLHVEVNGVENIVAGVASAEMVSANVTVYPALAESWVKVSGEMIKEGIAPIDASWLSKKLNVGDTVVVRLTDAVNPTPPTLTKSDPSAEATEGVTMVCSFCGKPHLEIQRMWAGPKALICNECISFMYGESIKEV